MKKGWEYKKLMDVCDFQGGSQPPKSQWIEHECPGYIRMLQIRDFTQSRMVKPEYIKITDKIRVCNSDDIMIGRYGASVGKILTGLSGAYNVALMRSIPNEEIISKDFLKYYLKSYVFQDFLKNSIGNRAAQAGFSKEDLSPLLIPVPPLSEQQRIVSYLDSAFAKIDAVAKNAEASLNEAKALFQSALTKMMEPKEGWEEKTLSMLGESKVGPFGSLLHKKDYIEGGIPIINPMHIVKGKISPNHKFTVSIAKLNKDLSSYLMHTNDIVIGRRGEMGRCAIVKPSQNGFVCGTGSIFFRPKTSIVNPRFLLTALLSSKSKKEMEALAGGATMLNLSSKSLSNLSIDIPSLQEQCAIVSTLDSLKSKVDQLQSNLSLTLTECTALKQAILRQTFE